MKLSKILLMFLILILAVPFMLLTLPIDYYLEKKRQRENKKLFKERNAKKTILD